MIVDWSGAPEDCVGALVACVGNIHFPRVTFVKSVIHEQNRVRGESCDGSALCAYLDVWAYEERPWTGEGLPPVGTVCEHRKLIPGEEWTEVEIVAHRTFVGDDYPCAVFVYSQSSSHSSSGDHFRPCRTPEQIAAEERLAAINYLEIDAGMCATAFDGDPEARAWVENLIDKGWRKPVSE